MCEAKKKSQAVMQEYPRIVFIGVHQESRAPFEYLLETGEKVVGLVTLTPEHAAKFSGTTDLASLAREANIPTLEVKTLNDEGALEFIEQFEPDIILVIGWMQLLTDRVLQIPKIACLGFHASLLPKYRGRAPVNWALINGETKTGNTLMVLAPGADEGDVVAQREIPIVFEDDCGTLYDKVSQTEVDMLAEILPLVRQGRMPRIRQDGETATVMPRRRPDDGLIDWGKDARRLYDWVRALTHPYPGAFTWLDGRKLYVWRAFPKPPHNPPADMAVGTVVHGEDGYPEVKTGSGWLELRRVQLEGEPELDGADAANTFLRHGRRLADDPAGHSA